MPETFDATFDVTIKDIDPACNQDLQLQIKTTPNGIEIAVPGYEEFLSIYLEKQQGALIAYIWGEGSEKNGGEPISQILMSSNVEAAMQRIDRLLESDS